MSRSLRRHLLGWIIVPIALIVVAESVVLYRDARSALNLAYDRSLLASARFIGEQLKLQDGQLLVDLPYTAFELLETGRDHLVYRITGLSGEFVAGYSDLPVYAGKLPQRGIYPALVDFYDATYRGESVRVAALYQPVASQHARGVALVQVAETRELRNRVASTLLESTLYGQLALVALVALLTGLVVSRALRPVAALRRELRERSTRDLSPLVHPDLPQEMQPLVGSVNELMQRMTDMLGEQQRFIRNASHQLRTPLAVLKVQLQGALSPPDDVAASRQALLEMHRTVDRAIGLANQMLALAKVDQTSRQADLGPVDLNEQVREVALDLSPLIAGRQIDFELQAGPAPVLVRGHDWMLRELVRNLLHNALRASPAGAPLLVQVTGRPGTGPTLLVRDFGKGLDPQVAGHLFAPFVTGSPAEGSGLGLAICRSICDALGASLEVFDRDDASGVDAVVRLPPAEGGLH